MPDYGGFVADDYVLTGYPAMIDGLAQCGDSGGGSGGSSSGTGGGPSGGGAPPSDGDLGAAIVAEARMFANYHEENTSYCNEFSSWLGRPCEQWCADYANYVWQQAGANTGGLTAAAISFYGYGANNGTWKDGAYADGVQPGDAVVWANSYTWGQHVGLVTAVNANGTISVINGDFFDDGSLSRVSEVTILAERSGGHRGQHPRLRLSGPLTARGAARPGDLWAHPDTQLARPCPDGRDTCPDERKGCPDGRVRCPERDLSVRTAACAVRVSCGRSRRARSRRASASQSASSARFAATRRGARRGGARGAEARVDRHGGSPRGARTRRPGARRRPSPWLPGTRRALARWSSGPGAGFFSGRSPPATMARKRVRMPSAASTASAVGRGLLVQMPSAMSGSSSAKPRAPPARRAPSA